MSEWNSMKTLDRYVHDYMVKRRMTRTAEIFATEACIASTEVAIDHPEGFLAEWWSIFWEVFKFRLQNHKGNDQEGIEEAGNIAQGASLIPPVPDPLVFGNILQSLFSTMPMSMPEVNHHLMQPATANLAMNPETFSVMTPSIPNPAANQQAVCVMQPSSSILNPAMKQHSCSLANMAMNQQAMGTGMVHSPSSVPLSIPAMVVRIPPISISMNNQQAMGMIQPLSPTPILDQQAMGSMRARSAIPMMGVMQPPSSIISSVIHQQMLAQIPEEMQGEPVSILLAKMYEQECLRSSARELAAKVQQVDTVKMNPIQESSSRYSHLQWQSADNIQQRVGREDKCPMTSERSNAVVPTSREASEAEIPDAGSSTHSTTSSSND